jgi:hypothetical protein
MIYARLRAFILGIREFRLGITTHFDDDLIETYDRGRELAHRITFRRWDYNESS